MRFLADENFNNQIIRGVLRRIPSAEFIRVQDTDLMGLPDPEVLAYAAEQNLIVLTHDIKTMRCFFYERIANNLPVSTLFLIQGDKPVGTVIDDLELILVASDPNEWEGQAHYIPL